MSLIGALLAVLVAATVSSCRPSDLETAQTRLPKLRQAAYEENGRRRPQERLPYEVLGSCLSTLDGLDVAVNRCLGGNEQPPITPRNRAFYLESSRVSQVITLRPVTGLLPEEDPRREYMDQPILRPQLDPFLVVDAYRSDSRTDFASGFPAHPHKGMLEIRHFHRGGLHHEDGCGNIVVTPPGGAQMLFAGRGIAHEEIPVGSFNEARALLETTKAATGVEPSPTPHASEDCLPLDPSPFSWDGFHGFQVWLQLPFKRHSEPPVFRSVAALPAVHLVAVLHTTKIDRVQRVTFGRGQQRSLVGAVSATNSPWEGGDLCPWAALSPVFTGEPDAIVRVLAGLFHNVTGPFTSDSFLYLDIELRGRKVCEGGGDDAHKYLTIDVPMGQNTLLYVFADGFEKTCRNLKPVLRVGSVKGDAVVVQPGSLVVLSDGSHVDLSSLCMGDCTADHCSECPPIRVLVMSAPPVKERVFVHQGFVGNSEDSIRDAVRNFKAGRASNC